MTTTPVKLRWEKYVASGDIDQLEAYLARRLWCIDLGVSLPSLTNENDTSEAPTSEWYALHYIAEGHGKWDTDVLAWGLNISGSDLHDLRGEITDMLVGRYRTDPSGLQRGVQDARKTDFLAVAYIHDEAIERFETLYSTLEPRFSTIKVPRFWRESAISAFVLDCSVKAQLAFSSPPKSKSTTIMASADGRTGVVSSTHRASLNFDCLDQIFAHCGLKMGTMRALARVLGFDRAEIECLIRRRCNPTPLLADLVAEPEELRGVMHDCDVVLVGSHATGFFWPGAGLADADWQFVTHPHVSHWLKFAAYLSSVGVVWSLPRRAEDSEVGDVSYSSDLERRDSGKQQVIRGTLWHKGQKRRLQLATHPEYPVQQSSIQEVLKSHSSIAQCFITGFGAACMYAQQTTSGQSHIWKVGDCHNSAPREEAQKEADKYVERGIDYIHTRARRGLDPGRIPEPRLRRLGDDGTLCVSFEQYSRQEQRERVRADFDLLQQFTWWEDCHGVEAVRQAGGGFWSLDLEDHWADRAISRVKSVSDVAGFDSMMARLQCSRCRVIERELCSAHKYTGSEAVLGQLIFFCLRSIERRRTSWSFLGLDFRWSDCWEYPYI